MTRRTPKSRKALDAHTDESVRTIAAFNAATGAGVDEGLIVLALWELQAQGWLTAATAPALTTVETRFLETHGGVRDNRDALVATRVASAARATEIERESMTVEQVAELLELSTSRVRHRLGDGSIYSYPGGGRGVARRIPYWQFHERTPTPHLAEVLAALPDDFTQAEIRDFALNAEVDHPRRDELVPLLDWLREGGDPEPARELAAAQAYVL